jgi:DNA repair protein RadA/Sms
MGRCISCGEWDTFEEVVVESTKKVKLVEIEKNKPVSLDKIITSNNYRLKTGINEFDRVLGGGIVPGSLVLIGGDPGIGKSTLMLQICSGSGNYKPLYITGEESLQQIKYRSVRLMDVPGDLQILAETNLETIVAVIENAEVNVIIVDSIQSIYSSQIDSTPGSIVQVRECASRLLQTAKKLNKAILIVGHVTKEGVIAGPKVLEHMVDTVLQFEGEKTYSYRILRAVKNRYGSTNEIGVFDMQNSGLVEVRNPSELFLVNREQTDPGVVIVAAMEGSRPILLEVQALVSPTGYSMPQRTVNGIELRRLQMILAVLEKRLGIKFNNYDVFANVAGGISINDPAVDLGIAAALVSSHRDQAVESDTIIMGEIGLTGEVRQISNLEQRIAEAEKLGLKKAFVPQMKNQLPFKSIKIQQVSRISLALASIFS